MITGFTAADAPDQTADALDQQKVAATAKSIKSVADTTLSA